MITIAQITKSLTDIEKRVLAEIKESEKNGYSDAKIRAALLKSGASPQTISKCMKLAHPLLTNVWLWVSIATFVLVISTALFVYLSPHPECTTDSDCSRGYECIA